MPRATVTMRGAAFIGCSIDNVDTNPIESSCSCSRGLVHNPTSLQFGFRLSGCDRVGAIGSNLPSYAMDNSPMLVSLSFDQSVSHVSEEMRIYGRCQNACGGLTKLSHLHDECGR